MAAPEYQPLRWGKDFLGPVGQDPVGEGPEACIFFNDGMKIYDWWSAGMAGSSPSQGSPVVPLKVPPLPIRGPGIVFQFCSPTVRYCA